MQPKIRFLLKVLTFSLVLFVAWKPLAAIYGLLLEQILQVVYPRYWALTKNESFPYLASLGLIPLAALLLATPRMSVRRKVVALLVGLAMCLALDATIVRSGVAEANSLGYGLYRSIKWLLPLVVWLVACGSAGADLLAPRLQPAAVPVGWPCPLCHEVHGDMADHIRSVHGAKSLKIKKVKKYLAKRPPVSMP